MSAEATVPEAPQPMALRHDDGEAGFLFDAPFAVVLLDHEDHVVRWNEATRRLLGWGVDDHHGAPAPVPPPDGPEADGSVLTEALHRDGTPIAVRATSLVLHDDERRVGRLVLLEDRRDDAGTRELAHVAEQTWQAMALRVTDAISFTHPDIAGFDSISTKAMSGSLSRFPGTTMPFLHRDDVERAVAAWQRVCAVPGRREQIVVRARSLDGHYEQLELTEVNLLSDPRFGSILIASTRVADRLHSERLVADEAHLLELIARDTDLDEVLPHLTHMAEYHSGSHAAILLLDEAGELTMRVAPSVPPAIAQLVADHRLPIDEGPAADYPTLREPLVVDIDALLDLAPGHVEVDWVPVLLEGGVRSLWTFPILDRRTDDLFGIVVLLVPEARPPSDYERRACEVVGHLTAIAIERSQWQRRIWLQARFDPLTKLPNRTHIFEQLDGLLAEARLRREPLTAMVLDLDRFAVINDSLGHAVGDELLVRFADRLRDAVGEVELVGRIAADEFVVAFPAGTRVREAKLAAARIADVLDVPFHLGDDDIYLTASTGIASSTNGQENADTLLQRADTAMFRAKALGRDRVEVYDDRLRSRAVRRLEVDRELRVALERGELVLYYQPEIDCRTGRIVGAEALLRWQHPTRGLIHPDGFIHVAEESGIIVPIGRWVLDEAVRQARTWIDALPSIAPFSISVNLSARQLINRSLVDTVAFALTRYAWPPSQLTLELTESILIEDRDATLYVLNRLRMLGVKLAIDDFGTGFASLDYLHRLHVDWIKIDRSFVEMLDAEGGGSPVATAMMHMARDFELLVTAEGVEEQRQFDGLKAIGCDLAQGFLFARPLPADELERLLRGNPSW